MEADKIASFKAQLRARYDQLVAEGAIQVAVEETGPVASDVDEDEQPYREMGQVIASNRNRERQKQLQGMEVALRRLELDPDAFGVCDGCGDEIAEKRLLLMPWARLCVGCQSNIEAGGRNYTRKKVTDFG